MHSFSSGVVRFRWVGSGESSTELDIVSAMLSSSRVSTSGDHDGLDCYK
jgi:hypothetical protein